MYSFLKNKSGKPSAIITTVIFGAAIGLSFLITGCASAKVDVLTRPQAAIPEPDMIIVYDLAVTPDEVKLDNGAAAKAMRETEKQTQDELEVKVGRAVAQAFTHALVDNLRKAGIKAAKASDGFKPTVKTLIIKGKFVQINQGNQTVRVLVGFGFGNGDVKAMVEAYQNNQLIAKAMVTTSGSLKPGVLVPVAGGAAAGSLVVSSAVAGGTTVLSESFQCDAERAAKDIAKQLVQGYINRGWAKPDAIDKINSMF